MILTKDFYVHLYKLYTVFWYENSFWQVFILWLVLVGLLIVNLPPGQRESLLKSCRDQIGMSVGHCLAWWLKWEGLTHCGCSILRPVGLGSIKKKKSNWAWTRKQASKPFLHGFWFSSCPDFPPWCTVTWKYKLNQTLSPPSCFWSECFITEIERNWDHSILQLWNALIMSFLVLQLFSLVCQFSCWKHKCTRHCFVSSWHLVYSIECHLLSFSWGLLFFFFNIMN